MCWAPPQHKGEFPLGALRLKVLQGGRNGWSNLLFVSLGQFPRHLQRALGTTVLGQALEERQQSVRCFVEHGGSRLGGDLLQALSTFFSFNRQESLEAEAATGQSTADQSRRSGAGSRDADHLKPCATRFRRQFFAGVADAGKSGVADHRHAVALAQRLQQLR